MRGVMHSGPTTLPGTVAMPGSHSETPDVMARYGPIRTPDQKGGYNNKDRGRQYINWVSLMAHKPHRDSCSADASDAANLRQCATSAIC
jgi:hypothetical protein